MSPIAFLTLRFDLPGVGGAALAPLCSYSPKACNAIRIRQERAVFCRALQPFPCFSAGLAVLPLAMCMLQRVQIRHTSCISIHPAWKGLLWPASAPTVPSGAVLQQPSALAKSACLILYKRQLHCWCTLQSCAIA